MAGFFHPHADRSFSLHSLFLFGLFLKYKQLAQQIISNHNQHGYKNLGSCFIDMQNIYQKYHHYRIQYPGGYSAAGPYGGTR